MIYNYGIDVSKYQGAIDWNKVKASGKKFAILKVTQKNNTVEPSFDGNYIGATLSGMQVGVYRYVYAKTVEEACVEAQGILNALKGKQIPAGIWLDMEDASIKGIGKDKLKDIIDVMAFFLRYAGFKVGIYCNLDWYKNVLPNDLPYAFWIARYPSSDNGTIKESLNPLSMNKVCAWQYSSKGKVNGITGNVDLNCATADIVEVMKVFG